MSKATRFGAKLLAEVDADDDEENNEHEIEKIARLVSFAKQLLV